VLGKPPYDSELFRLSTTDSDAAAWDFPKGRKSIKVCPGEHAKLYMATWGLFKHVHEFRDVRLDIGASADLDWISHGFT
jgi:hypothetical protein